MHHDWVQWLLTPAISTLSLQTLAAALIQQSIKCHWGLMIHTHFYGFSKPENGFVGKRAPLDRRFVWPVMNKFLQVEVIQLQLATSTATRFAIPIQD